MGPSRSIPCRPPVCLPPLPSLVTSLLPSSFPPLLPSSRSPPCSLPQSVDIVERALSFVRESVALRLPFYVNVWLHVSHNRLDPSSSQLNASHYQCVKRESASSTPPATSA